MKSLYSIAIQPSEEIIASVKLMKEQLAAKIGWFNSKNSLAHITLNEFEASDADLLRIKKQLTQLCDSLHPTQVSFTSYGNYPNNGAFFLAPDEESKKDLKVIMKHINDGLKAPSKFKSSDPHMSIARRLSPEKLAVADGFFPPADFSFLCDSVVLREFNPERKQFEVTEAFTFNGNTSSVFVQGSLF
ncbi:2'-5' RNA ligase family protein [Flavobacterium sp.]|uniref:2'-5' RNA ligase family protein n=1 Tax=Flavobacterium sp. TaxID=239 RepID=UPI003D6B5099